MTPIPQKGGTEVPLVRGGAASDTSHMRHPLKLSAAVSLLAYAAGAVAFLWRQRAW